MTPIMAHVRQTLKTQCVPFVMALGGGVAAACCDAFRGLAGPGPNEPGPLIGQPFLLLRDTLIGVGLYAALLLAGWWIIALLVRPFTRLHPSDAAAYFLPATALLLSQIAHPLLLRIHPYDIEFTLSPSNVLALVLSIGMAIGLGALLWVALRRIDRSRSLGASFWMPAYLIAVALVVEWFLWRWNQLQLGGDPGVFSPPVAFALIAPATLLGGIYLARTGSPARRMLRLTLAMTLLVALCAWVYVPLHAGHPAAVGKPSRSAPNVLLVSVDTLRADMLSCQGNTRFQTPHLDALARSGVRFQNAISPAPWTVPAVASFLTGVQPITHGMNGGGVCLPEPIRPVAEFLRQAGYRTAAIGRQPYLKPGKGFERGFDHYGMYPRPYPRLIWASLWLAVRHPGGYSWPDSDRLTDEAIDWLQHRHRPFFLWLHYLDPHRPYAPPRAYLNGATPPTDRMDFDFQDKDEPFLPAGAKLEHLTPAERQWVRELYEAEVRYIDDCVGRLMAALHRLRLADETIVILTSDHGEEFWEHGRWEHGHSLYQELIHVPLLVRWPGGPKECTVPTYVSTRAIPPTILELCGVEPHEPPDACPPSLVSLARGEPAQTDRQGSVVSEATIYLESLESVIRRGDKLIRSLDSTRKEFFHLPTDPAEQQPLSWRDRPAARACLDALEADRDAGRALRERFAIGPQNQSVDISPEDRKALEALGYL